ncbi:Peptide deformylase [Candidatus Portiera aleyrodidarum]|uniref:Peptide deformylase n=1 Tax=Candidatus Portiera aleyrodidarum TV TaxID=1297582 RepID=A0A8D4BUM7_9GAMM|nr:peptide deformylase [Candidatus Portiera aleyrodidarum]AGI27192.1 peptide deformylase [Candidatus Portiera aleyrodidarum TV]CEI59176.1 Peptide deformylase [Candidatus Portiera aleyrodidarum]
MKILKYPDKRLNIIAKPIKLINKNIKTLVVNMLNTMYAHKGIGLSATQINKHIRIFVMDISKTYNQPLIIINPKYTFVSNKYKKVKEGCLSIPNYFEYIYRSIHIIIKAIDIYGNQFIINAYGLIAQCIQHEIDHLNGKLLIDNLSKKG